MKVVRPSIVWLGGVAPDGARMLDNIAEAGRICYQSEPRTSSEQFVRRRIRDGHESILEHEKISVVICVDRGVTHEVVRHRIASYSQESTRYCNYSAGKFDSGITYVGISDAIRYDPKMSDLPSYVINEIIAEWYFACVDAEKHYLRMIELGASPQIARGVLNNSTKAQLAITMNLREWRHFFRLRCNAAAHPQMIEIAEMLLTLFKRTIPVVFDDIEAVKEGGASV